YGLPYSISIQHLVYQGSTFEEPPLSFEAVLNDGERFLIPGKPVAGYEVSDVLLAQYLHAGGRLVDSGGVATLDQEPLNEILSFYAQGVEKGIFNIDLLNYTSPNDYWTRFLQTDVSIAITSSDTYLQSSETGKHVEYAPVPTYDGEPLVIIDGWLWALTTTNVEQQRGALAFLEWMTSAEAQADYTLALHILPSRQRALRIWQDSVYAATVEVWLEGGIVIPSDQRNNNAAHQLQAAFEAVLNGAAYEDATSEALLELSSSG
ncbi:MAG TPA: extracellular solute-binding protein, partial [Aggregatilineales bacterium]|nr:extracellular solute-binding protein [Aggregatilineales bacterium]